MEFEKSGVTDCDDLVKSQSPSSEGCVPWSVKWQEGVGRCLVATRDIPACSVVLVDSPAMVAPYYDPQPMCVECMVRTDGSVNCDQCGLPLCHDKECRQGPRHRLECLYWTDLRTRVDIPQHAQNTPYLMSLLRLLEVRDNDPAMWSRLGMLMDHVEDQKQDQEAWETVQLNIVNWLLDPEKGGLETKYTSEEINRAMGLIQTNAINMEKICKGQLVSCKALYPTFSFISHSCVANARVGFSSDNTIKVIAQRDIKQGEEISIQYISHLFSNVIRRKEIQESWMFECKCERCLDPTELETHLGTILCSSCGSNTLPVDNTIDCPNWRCEKCGKEVSSDDVRQLSKDCEAKMMLIGENESDKYQQLLDEYENVFHSQHFQILLLKKYLAESLKGALPVDQIQKKADLLSDYMKTFEKIDSGYTKWKGMILVQVAKMSLFLANQNLRIQKINHQEFLSNLEVCSKNLETAMKCLQHEEAGSEAWSYYKSAKITASQANDILHFSKMMK